MASAPKRLRSDSLDSTHSTNSKSGGESVLSTSKSDDNSTEFKGSGSESQELLYSLQGSTDSSDQPGDSVVSTDFPCMISNWERKHLEDLNIKIRFQPETDPVLLVNRKVRKTGLQNYRVDVYDRLKIAEDKEGLKIASLVKYVLRSEYIGMLKTINYSTFDHLNIDVLNTLDMYVDNSQPCSFVPKDLPDDLKFWFDRFNIHGRSFTYCLYKMVEMKVKGLPIHECHFQHLFDTFTKMFGMHSGTSFFPCLHIDKMKIGKKEVSSSPVIVYSRRSLRKGDKKLENPRIVAVCELRKDRPLQEKSSGSPPNNKTREKMKIKDLNEVTSSSTPLSSGRKNILQISDKVIGQHGAKLLLKFPDSNRLETILGMVVTQTHLSGRCHNLDCFGRVISDSDSRVGKRNYLVVLE